MLRHFLSLFRRKRLDQDMTEEMRFHLEMQAKEHAADGLDPTTARQAAKRNFGGVDQIKERCRDQRGWVWLEAMVKDLGFAWRMLRKSPGFTATAVLTLALGIGACTAIFSVVNGVLLRALPYDQPNQLIQLWEDPSGIGQAKNAVAGRQFADWKEQATSMEDIAAIRRINMNLTGDGRPERLNVHQVSADYLHILRIRPLLGRDFLPMEDRTGNNHVVVVTHQFWQKHFGGDSSLVSRSIQLDSESYTVIGILPAQPQLPLECDMLVPFVFGSEPWHESRGDHRLRVIGRLKPNITIEQVRKEMALITQHLKPQYASWKKDWGVTVLPMHEQLTGEIRPQLWVLLGAVVFVLLIACANVAGLLLARMASRQKEIAVRAALGAGRSRVIRQLLTESLLLSSLGGALGVVFAYCGVHIFTRLGAGTLPRVQEIGIDPPALGFALLVSIVTGVAFGLAPALHLAKPDLTRALKQDGRTGSLGLGDRLRGALIVSEVALALMLLAGAGLMLKTLFQLQSVPSGFNPIGVLAMDMSIDDTKYPTGNRRSAFLGQIIGRIQTLPGVVTAGTATTLPMNGTTDTSIREENKPDSDEFYISADYDFVTGEYFAAIGTPLLQGRVFTEGDDSKNAPRVAILNQSLAERMFPGETPLGRHLMFWGKSYNVVGVVGDVRHRGPDGKIKEHIFVPQVFSPYGISLLVRAKVPPLTLVDTIRKEILKLDPDQPVSNVRTLEQVVANATGPRRLMFTLLGLFAGVAVLLAAMGLYGVMAYSVSQRTREIGIRMALGAQGGDVLFQIMRRGLRLTMLGVATGLLGSLALTWVLSHLLFGVSPRDPVTFTIVALLLVMVALLACWLPARRATKINPVEALRAE